MITVQKTRTDFNFLKVKVRKTYSQDWTAYNLAQTNEKLFFVQSPFV